LINASAQKRGWHTCPSKSIPAKQIEDFVIEQIKKIGYAPELIQDVVTSVADKMKGQLKQLEDERLALGRDTARWKIWTRYHHFQPDQHQKASRACNQRS
jgi:site-specific DNA recombinase